MKYDLSKKPNRGASHTLETFSSTMISLLQEKPFEKITVNEICMEANFPRATFYNYFDDKYDLLEYCWTVLSQELQLEHLKKPNDITVYVVLDKLYDYLTAKGESINRIMDHNKEDGYMQTSLYNYIKRSILDMCKAAEQRVSFAIPKAMVAEHYSNILMLIFKWWFMKGHPLTKEEMRDLLDRLLYGNFF